MDVRHYTWCNETFRGLVPTAGRRLLYTYAAFVFGIGLLTTSAKVNVPMWPVPMTMQTLAVLIIGMSYGARLGTATVAGYLIVGALGLPVFAGTPERGLGLVYMVGPTGGYLVGFLIGAFVVGWLREQGWHRGFWRAAAAMAIGHIVILLAGVAWLAILIGTQEALAVGLVPFLLGSFAKILLGAALFELLGGGLEKFKKGVDKFSR